MILVDTNVFLELLMDQEKADDCEKLLSAVSEGKIEAVVSRFTLHAIESVVKDPEALSTLLRNIENSAGLYIYDTNTSDEFVVSLLMKALKRDFDDSLQYYVSKKVGAKAIVSFDRHLDQLDIPRAEPDRALSLFGGGKVRGR